MMVKICGITNREDALAAVEGGAAALGFNFYPPSPRYIAPEQAAGMIAALPPGVWKVGVFVDEPAECVAETARRLGLDIAQLHGAETPDQYPPGVRVWKAFRVRGSAPDWSGCPAEAVLLDGPASGHSFDWTLAAAAGRRVILAGGLDADNVRQAIETVRPWGVDACSRIESEPGRKDPVKMAQFLKAALAERS